MLSNSFCSTGEIINHQMPDATRRIYSYLMWSNMHVQFRKRPFEEDSKARAETNRKKKQYAACYKTHKSPHVHHFGCYLRASFPVRELKIYIFYSTWKFYLMASQGEAEIHGLYSFMWHLDCEVMQRGLWTWGEEMGKSCVKSWVWFNVSSG